MTAPVEARSLSSLTTLFANPPQYPRNPTHKVLEPLVLYIVRVPGSRDVFLTPLKPPTKSSISAEAIQSSLYYFHIPTPEDDAVKDSLGEQSQSWNSGRGGQVDTILRKPLPSPFGEPSANQHLQTSPQRHSFFSTPVVSSEGHARAARHSRDAEHNPRRSLDGGTPIARKPVGPRPLSPRLQTADSGIIERKPVRGSREDENRRERSWMEHSSRSQTSEPPRSERLDNSMGDTRHNEYLTTPTRGVAGTASDQFTSAPPLPARPVESWSEPETEKDFRVTIIRRDPTSGSQWNIGSLSRESRPAILDSHSLKVQVTTPGYQKFARQAVGGDTASGTSRDLSTPLEDYHSAFKPFTMSSTSSERTPFTRDITLNRPPSSQRPKSLPHHQRSNSSDSFPFSIPPSTGPLSPTPRRQLTFQSPWNGICTFSTGMDGRSLKCRHKLPSNNPDQSDNSALVAELRFNLPWSALRNRDTNARDSTSGGGGGGGGGKRPRSLAILGEDAKHSFKKGMARIRQELHSTTATSASDDMDVRTNPSRSLTPQHHHHHHQHTSSTTSFPPDDSADSDSGDSDSTRRLDLRLGREAAGGGRKGKNAKLGKLVLRDEGLKMADLVVAACMGVWWDVCWGTESGTGTGTGT